MLLLMPVAPPGAAGGRRGSDPGQLHQAAAAAPAAAAAAAGAAEEIVLKPPDGAEADARSRRRRKNRRSCSTTRARSTSRRRRRHRRRRPPPRTSPARDMNDLRASICAMNPPQVSAPGSAVGRARISGTMMLALTYRPPDGIGHRCRGREVQPQSQPGSRSAELRRAASRCAPGQPGSGILPLELKQ